MSKSLSWNPRWVRIRLMSSSRLRQTYRQVLRKKRKRALEKNPGFRDELNTIFDKLERSAKNLDLRRVRQDVFRWEQEEASDEDRARVVREARRGEPDPGGGQSTYRQWRAVAGPAVKADHALDPRRSTIESLPLSVVREVLRDFVRRRLDSRPQQQSSVENEIRAIYAELIESVDTMQPLLLRARFYEWTQDMSDEEFYRLILQSAHPPSS